MAESIEGLYLRLGLSLDELSSDFISAERSVTENMNRLNREMQVIRLRTEADLSGLDEVRDAAARFQVQQNSLNQQISVQRQRISLANAAYEDMRRQLGENSVATQRAQLALERERTALARLKSELRNLNEAQNETNEQQNNLIGNFSNLSGKAGMAVAGLTAIAGAMVTAGEATRSLIENFKELQKQSYELDMPFQQTKEFLRHMKLAGGDIGDWEGFVRGITDAWIKGDTIDPEVMALKKYGAEIEDATGRLKDFQQISEEIFQAYEKAKVNGEGTSFLQMLGGEMGIRDAIQYLERYREAKEDAAKIVDAGLNFSELHEAEREINLLDEQMGEFGNSLKNAIIPSSRAATKELFELFRDGTAYVKNNKDELQKWQFIAIEAAESVKDALSDAFKPLAETGGISGFTQKQNEELKKIFSEMDKLNNFDNSLWGQASSTFFGDLFSGMLQRAEMEQIKYQNEVEETTRRTEELESASKEMTDTLSYGLRDSLKRAQEYKDETADINIDLEFDDGSIDKAYAKLDQWYEQQTRSIKKVTEEQKAQIEEMLQSEELSATRRNELQDLLASKFKISKEEEAAIEELYIKKVEQIEQEHYQKLQEVESEFSAARDALYQTELEKRLAQIEQEKEAWIQKGIDEVKATELAEQQKVEAARNAAMNVLKSQLADYRAFRDGGYEALQARMLADLRKQGITDLDLQINPQGLQDFLRAQKDIQNSFLPNFQGFNETINSNLNEMAENVKKVNPSLEDAKSNLTEIEEPLATVKTNLSDITPSSIESMKESFSGIAESVDELPTLFDSLSESILNLIDTIADLPEKDTKEERPSANPQNEEKSMTPEIDISLLQTSIESINTAISENNNVISQVQSIMSESINTLSQMLSTVTTTSDSLSSVKTALDKVADIKVSTPTVNVTQNINEPHAWDNGLIQELADKVADKMKNEIIYAIKGSYGY